MLVQYFKELSQGSITSNDRCARCANNWYSFQHKFAYALIFIYDVESKFLETQLFQFLIWFRYAEVFFILDLKKCLLFLTNLINYKPHTKSTYAFDKEHIIPGFKCVFLW